MLGKFLMACGVYVGLAAVIGGAILLVMRAEDAKIWPLCVVALAYLIAFAKIGCDEH